MGVHNFPGGGAHELPKDDPEVTTDSTLRDQWRVFESWMVKKGKSGKELTDMRLAFYAGATMMVLFIEALGALPEDEQADPFARMYEEAMAFGMDRINESGEAH